MDMPGLAKPPEKREVDSSILSLTASLSSLNGGGSLARALSAAAHQRAAAAAPFPHTCRLAVPAVTHPG